MKVKVLYFAAVRELVGVDEETMDLPDAITTIRAFAAHVETARPVLTGRMASVRVARNEAFATPDEAIAEGDTLALIPPVAGG